MSPRRSGRDLSRQQRLPARPIAVSRGGARRPRRRLRVLLWLTLLLVLTAATIAVISNAGQMASAGRSAGDARLRASEFQHPGVADPDRERGNVDGARSTGALDPVRDHGGAAGAVIGSATLARMLGQMIVTCFSGERPSASLLARIRHGQVGGVILFADNVAGGETATRNLIDDLQRAAGEGGNPPLLIMTDQEGGEVRRLAWAPPALAASAMGSPAIARAQGSATARALRAVGVNVDLAPVADVERVAGSFLGTRSFGSGAALVAARACAFAEGLASQGVAFTLKHFPGLGRALTDTDIQPTTVEASQSALRGDYQAYRRCGASPGGLVMVSSAIYPSLTGTSQPAVLSREIYHRELQLATGGMEPLTISDDLQTPSIADQLSPEWHAVNAGLDLLMYAQTEAGSAAAYTRLVSIARSGGIERARIENANQAIERLKELVA
jgi:beta-N-acetylhexosaminidase